MLHVDINNSYVNIIMLQCWHSVETEVYHHNCKLRTKLYWFFVIYNIFIKLISFMCFVELEINLCECLDLLVYYLL